MMELLDNPHFLMRLSQRVFNRPLLMEETELNVIVGVLGARVGIRSAEVPLEARVRSTSVKRGEDSSSRGTAVIPIVGPLVHRRSGSALSGGPTTYSEIRAAFKEAANDPEIGAILLDVDSGGGEVSGVFDLADEIRRAAASKPVFAYVNESAFSAAYALASAATKVWMPRTGSVGSIGVIALHKDESARDMAEGVKYTPVYAGDAKYDFSQHAPLNDRARQGLQAMVDEVYELFTGTVARHRSMTQEAVKNTQARIYSGQAAVDMGLADEIMTFDEALERTCQAIGAGGAMHMDINEGEKVMATENSGGTLTMEQLQARLASLEAENSQLKQKADSAADSEARFQIFNACLAVSGLLGGVENARALADTLVKEGVSMAVAHERILKAASERQSQEEIRSSVGTESYGDVNPLDKACDALIAQMPKSLH